MTEEYDIKAVLFDWAGTTMDYGCMAPAVVFREIFAQYGVPITMEEARRPMGAHKKVHIRKITQDPDVARRWNGVYGRAPHETDVENMFKDFVPAQLKVLADYSGLIPGTLEAIAQLRERGIKIGSTTGYTGEMMRLLMNEAGKRGYYPDVTVCSTGDYAIWNGHKFEFGKIHGLGGEEWNISRPKPHMCTLNATLLGVDDPKQCVKVGDTVPDVFEGKNAGMWTVGLALTGNEMGLTEEEINKLPLDSKVKMLDKSRRNLAKAGADYVVDGIWDVPSVVNVIDSEIKRGLCPGQFSTIIFI